MGVWNDNLTHFERSLKEEKVFYVNGTAELDTGDELYTQIKTPADKNIHLFWDITSNQELETYLYEAPTEQSDGTLTTPLNLNRQSTNTSDVIVRKGVSAPASTGLTIDEVKEGYSSRRIKAGFSDSNGGIILKKNTVYIRKFKSLADNNVITFKATWIEE